MAEPVIAHPAADRATPEALVVEQDRSVVPLSTWMVDAAVVAGRDGRLLQIVTPADSRLTYPLELMLGEGGSQWIVRSGAGFREGFTGAPMSWTGGRFFPVDGPIPEPDHSRDAALGSMELQISTLHPAAVGLELGASTVAATSAMTGSEPAGWGATEPVTEPWSTSEVTAFCRDRAPDPTSLVVVGGRHRNHVVGRLQVRRVAAGVLEEVRLAGPAASAVGQDAVEQLAADLAGTARTMVVGVHPIRADGTRPAEPSTPPVPFGMLVGHAVVAERGAEYARFAPASSVRMLRGRKGTPACWCRFDGGPDEPYLQLAAVLRHFGLTR